MNELSFIRKEKRAMRSYINKFRALGSDYDPDDYDYDPLNPYSALGSFFVLAREQNGALCKKVVYDAPCHYDLKADGYEYMPAGCVPIAVADYTHRIEILDDSIQQHAKSFITYIEYESPFSVCYINKGRKRYKHEHELNVHRTGNEIAAACIAMRQAYEFGNYFLTAWGKLLEIGIDKNVAWLASYFLQYVPVEDSWRFSNWQSGHDVMSTNCKWQDVMDFLANGFNPKHQYEHIPYKYHARYEDVYGTIGKEIGWRTPGGIQEWVKEHCPEAVSGHGFNAVRKVTQESVLQLCIDIQNETIKAKK